MRYVTDRPFAEPEAAARKLLEIVLAKDIDVGQYAYTGATNSAFLQAGGDVGEYIPPAGISRSRRAGSRWTVPERGSSCCSPARICREAPSSQIGDGLTSSALSARI